MTQISIRRGDITTMGYQGIVNAANNTMRGGGGVDGAIHAAAGPDLKQYVIDNHPYGCHTGAAIVTPAFGKLLELGTEHIIHTVGPDCRVYTDPVLQRLLLESAYENCVIEAFKAGITSIAFPAISTGVYDFDPYDAAAIAIKTIARTVAQSNGFIEEVALVAFDEKMLEILNEAANEHARFWNVSFFDRVECSHDQPS